MKGNKLKQTRKGSGRKADSPNGELISKNILVTFTSNQFDLIEKKRGEIEKSRYYRRILIENLKKQFVKFEIPNGELLIKKISITFTKSQYDLIIKEKGNEEMSSFCRNIILGKLLS